MMAACGARDRNRTYLALHVKQVTSPEERLGHELLAPLTGIEPALSDRQSDLFPDEYKGILDNVQNVGSGCSARICQCPAYEAGD